MIIERLKRHEMPGYNLTGKPPEDALASLRELDDKFELFLDGDTGQWAIYRLTIKGVSPSEDVLSYQIKVPKGPLTTGVKAYAQRFDQNPMGMKDSDELKKDFMQRFKEAKEHKKKFDQKLEDDLFYYYDDVTDHLATNRISVPITVGIKNGKPLRMAKYGK